MITKRKARIGLAIIALVIFAMSFYLFYCYITDVYASDFPSHIRTVLQGREMYSLMHRIIAVCYRISQSEIILSALMSFLVIGTAYGMYVYLNNRVAGGYSKEILILLAFALLFTSNIYLPKIFPHFYNHYTKVSQPWHNSTYILMRLFSVFVLVLYFKMYDQMKNGEFTTKIGVCFCIVLSLCNFAKPNFFLAFAPMAFFVFMHLFLKAKGRNFKQLLQWGSCFLLSMPCMFFMVNVVYDESENSTIAFSLENFVDYVFGNAGVGGHRGQFLICEFSNLFFPLFVLTVFLVLKYKKEKIELDRIIQGFALFFIAHLQQLLMIDEGPRRASGNYAWGVYGIGMLLFLISISEWLWAYKNGYLKNKHIFLIGIVIFILHIVCGVIYFVMLHQGSYIL